MRLRRGEYGQARAACIGPLKRPWAYRSTVAEGPGSYGLNRNVALTILMVKENRVTANFALVQPRPASRLLPKVLDAIFKIVGGPVPKLDDVLASADARADLVLRKMNESPARSGQPNAINEQLRPYLRPIIQKDASESDVKAAMRKLKSLYPTTPTPSVN